MFITFGVSYVVNFFHINQSVQNISLACRFLVKQYYIVNMILYFLGYKDLHSRKEIRESAWRLPGWDECVAYTVPLIREMHSRILRPTHFSTTK